MAQDDKDKTKEEVTETDKVEETVSGPEIVEKAMEEGKSDENVEEKEKEEDGKEEEVSTEVVEESVDEGAQNEEVEEAGSEEASEESTPKDSEERIPEFRSGDTIKVFYKIIEGDKVRTQPYQGIVIAMKGTGLSRTFTVRKIGADNIGVERIFPIQSPNIEKIKLIKSGKVRRAKLYYLRGRIGRKATQIKERVKAK